MNGRSDPGAAPNRSFELQLSSRGDTFAMSVLTPAARAPVLLFLPDPREADAAPPREATLDSGLALACVDLPLCGRRHSPKLSLRLRRGLLEGASDTGTALLVEEFARQASAELACVVDALHASDALRGDRLALAGVGLGAALAARVAARDARVRAIALLWSGGAAPPADLDPVECLADLRSRPVWVGGCGADAGLLDTWRTCAEAEATDRFPDEDRATRSLVAFVARALGA